MTEKTSTKKTAATKKASEKKTTTRAKAATKKPETEKVIYMNAENVGFKAGDVYQTLATAGKPLTVAEIAKSANIFEEEVLLGMGWLFKEGKIREEDSKITLA